MNDSSNNIFLSDGQNAATSGKLTHGSLFSGIGGFDLAAEWMGWENIFHCEWNEFGQRVLKYYWPKAISYEDITKTDFSIHRGKIDILTGGFPCQPYSSAGKRLGSEDDRHLWTKMLRAIREIKPRYIVGENVYGLTNWNGGLVFNEVQTDLENEGYKVQPCILPACAVNAPHRRDRVWFVAYSNERTKRSPRTSGETESDWNKNNDEQGSRGKQTEQHNKCSNVLQLTSNSSSNGHELRRPGENRQTKRESKSKGDKRERLWNDDWRNGKQENVTDTCNERLQRRKLDGTLDKKAKKQREQPSGSATERHQITDWEQWPTQSPICSGNDGLSNQLDGITFPKWRQESIKVYGNAIVPQVAYQIFKALMITETKAREEKNIITGDMHEPSLNERT